MLVVPGATPEGRKELLGFQVGVRESAQSWRELLIDLKARGLAAPPELAVGDGALGFRKAMDEAFPGSRHQRCWLHTVANVLNHFPPSLQLAVTADLREVSHAETRASARAALETFKERYAAKYARGVACLTQYTEALLASCGLRPFPPQIIPRMICRYADRRSLPAEHWDHLRTVNPIESVFATVRHRTVRTKGGALSQNTATLMVFTLIRAASNTSRKPNGTNQLLRVTEGVTFIDGVAQSDVEQNRAAGSDRATQIQV